MSYGGSVQMSRGDLKEPAAGVLARRIAFRIRRTIRRVITTHPTDTTMRRTQATVRTGSRKNSAMDGSAAMVGAITASGCIVEHRYHVVGRDSMHVCEKMT